MTELIRLLYASDTFILRVSINLCLYIDVIDTTRDYSNGLILYAYCFNDPINDSNDEGNIPNWLKWFLDVFLDWV